MSEDNQTTDQLRARIEAAEARNEQRSVADYASSARDGASGFVRDHPLTTVAGGIVVGLVIGSMIP